MNEENKPVLASSGHCVTCDRDVEFVATNAWLRDHFFCRQCGSIPRERALMHVIETFYPQWRTAKIHESSPGGRGASTRLASECAGYVASQYFKGQAAGRMVEGVRNETLEALSFANDSFDLHITQDVLEHVFHPAKVFREIARTLKPGGMHIFTVPLVNKNTASRLRAKMDNGAVVHLADPVYHGNPIEDGKSLVTIDWGYDICRKIFESSGLFTTIIKIDDLNLGIRAEYIEVLVSFKPEKELANDWPD